MRRIMTTVVLSTICWNVAGALLIHMHLNGPDYVAGLWFMTALAVAATATLAGCINRRDQPVGISYDLGWQQGYRTAEQKYLALLAQWKGTHGKTESPSER
ncbi:hypothetical protein [Nonomuraea sp. GTA35]|uniref:hypothetical protein n=1 Tax=Nonomuraea sp. GTA35 TaxID=1676746 RepID=UPI0035C2455F